MKVLVKPENKDSDLTAKIIGCAMKVHSTLGNGFQEIIYQRSLGIEMEKQKMTFLREVEIPIYYDGVEVGKKKSRFPCCE